MNIELHSAVEVADTLGVELDTLYRYARKGSIHGLKVGKAWKFMEADIQDFLQKHRYSVKTPQDKATRLRDILRRAGALPSLQGSPVRRGTEASYAEVDAASNVLADNLLRNGLAAGEKVLILLANSVEFVVACFAVWKTGAALVPEDPLINDENLRCVLENCAPQALIVDRNVADRLGRQRHGLQNVRVVYVKSRMFALAGLETVRIESLDAVLDKKTGPKIHLYGDSLPDKAPSLAYSSGSAASPEGVMASQHS